MKSVIPPSSQLIQKKPGNDLLSHLVPQAVPSALKGFTSVFGMGTGVSPLLWLPGKCLIIIIFRKYLAINYTLNKIYGQASELVLNSFIGLVTLRIFLFSRFICL